MLERPADREVKPRHRFLAVLLSCGMLWIALEEISYGQRIFGFSSPELFKAINTQKEVNLHNLAFVSSETGLAHWWNVQRLFSLFWLGYCVMFPLVRSRTIAADPSAPARHLPRGILAVGCPCVVPSIRYTTYESAIDRRGGTMETVTVSPKYQVVIPKSVRGALRLLPGQKLQVVAYDDRIELIPVRPARSMRGFLEGIDTDVPREDDRV